MVSLTSFGKKQSIKPLVADQFGKIIAIEATFIEKPNDYHSQNIVKEPYLLSVVSVNGQKLSKPIIIEYISSPEIPKIKTGQKYTLQAYETIYTWGEPRNWVEMSQFDYQIIHRLIIRNK